MTQEIIIEQPQSGMWLSPGKRVGHLIAIMNVTQKEMRFDDMAQREKECAEFEFVDLDDERRRLSGIDNHPGITKKLTVGNPAIVLGRLITLPSKTPGQQDAIVLGEHSPEDSARLREWFNSGAAAAPVTPAAARPASPAASSTAAPAPVAAAAAPAAAPVEMTPELLAALAAVMGSAGTAAPATAPSPPLPPEPPAPVPPAPSPIPELPAAPTAAGNGGAAAAAAPALDLSTLTPETLALLVKATQT